MPFKFIIYPFYAANYFQLAKFKKSCFALILISFSVSGNMQCLETVRIMVTITLYNRTLKNVKVIKLVSIQ